MCVSIQINKEITGHSINELLTLTIWRKKIKLCPKYITYIKLNPYGLKVFILIIKIRNIKRQ